MQNARVKALIITNYCGLSSLVKPDTVKTCIVQLCKNGFVAFKQSKILQVIPIYQAQPVLQ
jgi:hypothetical protein